MTTCSNCYNIIQEEIVYSVVDKSPMCKSCANICPTCGGYLTDLQFARNKCKCIVQKKSSLELVRRSHIELYKQCPYAFNLEVIKGVERETNAYALHGIILHEIFDKYSKIENISEEELRKEWLDRYFKEMPKDNISFKDNALLYEQLFEKGHDAIEGFMAFYNSTGQPHITEENIIFKLDDALPEVSITMDRVDIDEHGDYHMFDYKCGNTFTGKKLSEDLQVPLYCYAMLYKYGKLPKTFTFLFVSEGKERKYELIDDMTYRCTVRKRDYDIDVDARLKYTMSLLRDIANEKFNTMCKNFWHCNNMCYYKKSGKCDGGDMKIW